MLGQHKLLHCIMYLSFTLINNFAADTSGGGFFDSAVGSQFASGSETRSEPPTKAAPQKAAPAASASGMFFVVPLFTSNLAVQPACVGNDAQLSDNACRSPNKLLHAVASASSLWPSSTRCALN